MGSVDELIKQQQELNQIIRPLQPIIEQQRKLYEMFGNTSAVHNSTQWVNHNISNLFSTENDVKKIGLIDIKVTKFYRQDLSQSILQSVRQPVKEMNFSIKKQLSNQFNNQAFGAIRFFENPVHRKMSATSEFLISYNSTRDLMSGLDIYSDILNSELLNSLQRLKNEVGELADIEPTLEELDEEEKNKFLFFLQNKFSVLGTKEDYEYKILELNKTIAAWLIEQKLEGFFSTLDFTTYVITIHILSVFIFTKKPE